MKTALIHLSDLHYRLNWEEDQGLVLNAFFQDLEKQIKASDNTKFFIVFTGDIVLAGSDTKQYEAFFNHFDKELNKLNIPKKQRICVPGNHDIATSHVSEFFIEHEGIVSQKLDEKAFNDYTEKKPELLTKKFANYISFEEKFAEYGIGQNILSGRGWDINPNIGIYCSNSAICSTGGTPNAQDNNRLSIDTRNLQKWILESPVKNKIFIMHHPIQWLTDWSQEQLKTNLSKDFSLFLSGHVHDQAIYHIINKEHDFIECSAPPLLTNKHGDLGYSIIFLGDEGVEEIQYRQWTKSKTFVTGVNFSDTDDGKIIIRRTYKKESNNTSSDAHIKNILQDRLNSALVSYPGQPIIWTEPTLQRSNDISRNPDDATDNGIKIIDFITNPTSIIVKAPPQFGLTCLSHYFAKLGWESNKSFWLYLDAKETVWHSIDKAIEKELNIFKTDKASIGCIILDSWTDYEKDSIKLLQKLSEKYSSIPIIVMHTIDDAMFMANKNQNPLNREFEIYYLKPLTRGSIRKVVSAYNDVKHIGDEDTVITKVVSDLETLNLHRTPLNCLTLLKVSETNFDESPINRTEMLRMVLFLLFNMDNVPTYKSKPDLKDCEYVLGRFCEKLIRENKYSFTREDFSKELIAFCKERVIDLEVDVVFDVLFNNNLLINRDEKFYFRCSYWIFYFAAQRMNQDPSFAKFIFDDDQYVNFPEIIEFYTGIDRNRNDVLTILTNDLKKACDIVNTKVGLPDDLDPYRIMTWSPTSDNMEKMKKELTDEMQKSKLPDEIKDQFADRSYNANKPYNQSIQQIFNKYSLVILWQKTRAASRALRNSSYANPDVKRELLNEIMRSWKQISDVLLFLSPFLAINGHAAFDGAGVILYGNFGENLKTRIHNILIEIPSNMVDWFKDDLYSIKMGSLLFDHLEKEKNELKKHELVRLIICERPVNWSSHVENYISSISKNSFYLFDLFRALRIEYAYSFVSPKTLYEIKNLTKMCIAKHEFGTKIPGKEAIKKISDKILPDRMPTDK